ncbi:MAG: hypothetical protein J3K34DRAFT_526120 [Monoraphidium minutum]|nr:MAG: hypothetical protein J3K34DRAFT_526120 [Monoraphidium minutum]
MQAGITRRSFGLAAGATLSLPASSKRVAAAAAMSRIDAHVHVWAPADQQGRFPYAGALLGAKSAGPEPPLPGDAELLLGELDAAGVGGALIVQPGNHLYDHSYVISVLEAHPQRFAGCLLADPRPGGGGAAEIERLHRAHGFRAVRFNPYLWPEGEGMANEVGRAMYQKAGELGMPVAHMPFKGLLGHVDEIEELAASYPRTPVVIDHFGFCGAGDTASEEWRRLLALARHPQVHVKSSAFFRVSKEPYPYRDAVTALRLLVDSFGARRVMWGTDWPWVQEHGGYSKAWGLLDAADPSALTEEERRWVMGGTARALFPGAWGGGGGAASA